MGAVVAEREGGVTVTVAFEAPPEVQAFIQDPTFVTGYFGPLGCAKSTGLVMKGWQYATDWPGAKIAVIRSTWPALEDTTLQTFFEWFPDGVAGHYYKTKKQFSLWLGDGVPPATFLFRGLDGEDDIQKVLSLEIAAAALDEPQGGVNIRRDGSLVVEPGINHDLYLAILGRCGRQRGYPKMLWMGGNPPAPSHWISREFSYRPGKSGHDDPTNPNPLFHLYLGTRETNRHNLPPRYYEDLESLYGVGTPMARRYLDGEWIEWATEQPFHSHWFRYFGTDEEPSPNTSELKVMAGFDPAISKSDRAARSALVVCGQQQRGGVNRGRIYVLYQAAGHWSVYEQVDALLKAVVQWKIHTVLIEDVAYQKALGDVLDREARQRGITVHIELVKPDGDKLRRANAWSPLVEDGTVLFGPGMKGLVDAMLAVPNDPMQWDLVDAAGICVRGFPLMQGESERLPWIETPAATRATGYATRPKSTEHGKPRVVPRGFTKVGRVPALKRAMGYAVRPAPNVPVGAGKYS